MYRKCANWPVFLFGLIIISSATFLHQCDCQSVKSHSAQKVDSKEDSDKGLQPDTVLAKENIQIAITNSVPALVKPSTNALSVQSSTDASKDVKTTSSDPPLPPPLSSFATSASLDVHQASSEVKTELNPKDDAGGFDEHIGIEPTPSPPRQQLQAASTTVQTGVETDNQNAPINIQEVKEPVLSSPKSQVEKQATDGKVEEGQTKEGTGDGGGDIAGTTETTEQNTVGQQQEEQEQKTIPDTSSATFLHQCDCQSVKSQSAQKVDSKEDSDKCLQPDTVLAKENIQIAITNSVPALVKPSTNALSVQSSTDASKDVKTTSSDPPLPPPLSSFATSASLDVHQASSEVKTELNPKDDAGGFDEHIGIEPTPSPPKQQLQAASTTVQTEVETDNQNAPINVQEVKDPVLSSSKSQVEKQATDGKVEEGQTKEGTEDGGGDIAGTTETTEQNIDTQEQDEQEQKTIPDTRTTDDPSLSGDGKTRPATTTPPNREGEGGEDDFPAFDKWSMQYLAEQEKQKIVKEQEEAVKPGPVLAQKKLRHNFAAEDCGAKVVSSNPEAEHMNHLLNGNPDEYMISPCKAKKWFVVELCEPIQIRKVELGTLELFSSQPKSFRVASSKRFPTKKKTELGQFEMTVDRTVQSFSTKINEEFFKFVRVDMLDHHGKEHYCPLTTLRVLGIDMALDDDDDDEHDNNDGEGHETEHVEVEAPATKGAESLFNKAKDTVVKLVQKVLYTGENEEDHKEGETSEPPTFRIRPNNKTTAFEGQPAMIHCAALGRPLPLVTWYKDGRVIGASSKQESVHIEPLRRVDVIAVDGTESPPSVDRYVVFPNGTLLLRKVLIEDRGQYGCTANNSAGLIRAELSLIVFQPVEEDEDFDMVKTVVIVVCIAMVYLALVIGLIAFCSYRLLKQRKQRRELMSGAGNGGVTNAASTVGRMSSASAAFRVRCNNLEFYQLPQRGDLFTLEIICKSHSGHVYVAKARVHLPMDPYDVEVVKKLTTILRLLTPSSMQILRCTASWPC